MLDVIDREVVIERFLPLLNNSLTHSDGWADMGVVVTQIGDRLGIDDTDFHYLAPIAALFAGDFLVLDYRVDADEPGISLWNHELSEEDTPSTDLVAESFPEFLQLIQIET